MADAATKLPVKTEAAAVEGPASGLWPFDSLRREINRLFDDFGPDAWGLPSRRSLLDIAPAGWLPTTSLVYPAVDVVDKDKTCEITAELPGIEEKDIEITFSNGVLTIKGEKEEKTEQKKKDYYMSERRFGSFRRSFQLPAGIDPDKIEASFKKGVLTVTLPKTAAAQSQEKKIPIGA